jgi:hypothetical protein
MVKCVICGTESDNKTCGGSCRAKLQRRTRTVAAHAHGTQPQQAAGRANPDLLNYGEPMTADELNERKSTNKLSHYHNRIPIPGDSDYTGCCVCVDGKWQVRQAS